MKRTFVIRKVLVIAVILLPLLAVSQVRVRGYIKKDGTYVQPHVRSSPDGAKYNNWSTKGNTNPYTGKDGTKDPYSQSYGTSGSYSVPSYSTPNYSSSGGYSVPNYDYGSPGNSSGNSSSAVDAQQPQEQSDWEFAGKTTDGVLWYFIPRTVTVEGSLIKAWIVSSESPASIIIKRAKSKLSVDGFEDYSYTMTYEYIDCARKQYFIKEFVFYDKNGKVLDSSSPTSPASEKFGNIAPGSIMEGVANAVCQYAGNPNRAQLQTYTPAQAVPNPEASLPESYHIEKNRLIGEGWSRTMVTIGQMVTCYGFFPQKGDVDNYLEIHVGSSTDVVLKIMDCATNVCVRYVYVHGNSTYKARNIPPSRYYLKIAYGKEWYSKIENGQCVGRFLLNPLYKKGEEILDFNLQYDHVSDDYNVPSYSVKLDVISSNRENLFDTSKISEDEFNR
jgi:hypothetical protein